MSKKKAAAKKAPARKRTPPKRASKPAPKPEPAPAPEPKGYKDGPGPVGKYTPETVKKITDALRLGETARGACWAAGIHETTFYDWRATKPEFEAAVIAAMSELRCANLARIERAAATRSWQAAAWILERRFPDEFGRRTVEVTGPGGGFVPIVTEQMERGELAKLIRSDPIARKAHLDTLQRLGVRESESGSLRLVHDANGKRTVAAGDVPHSDSRSADAGGSGGNKAPSR